jgi:hypothetical protein
MRRAVRLGNGWHPSTRSPEALRQGIRYLHEQAHAAGRDVAEIPVSLSIPLGDPTVRGDALGRDHGAIVEKIRAYADIGVQMITIPGHTDKMTEILPALEMLSRQVLPMVQ